MSQKKNTRSRSVSKRKAKKRRLRLARLFALIIPVLVIGLGVWFAANWFTPLKLESTTYVQEYKQEFDPLGNVKSIFLDSRKNIETKGEVDTSKIGTYNYSYIYKGKEYPFSVEVKDTIAPEMTLKEYTTDSLETVKAENFIESITDSSLYTYKMDNREDEKKPGTYNVIFTAKDQYGNESTQNIRLIRKEDKQAPTLEGFEKQLVMMQGGIYDSGMYPVVDNLDKTATVYCDTSKLDTKVPGQYNVPYTVRDRTGNEATYVQQVTVQEDPDFGRNVVYLTFDDGPSEHTPELLNILDRYNAKATFFVTGIQPDYFEYMKEIVDRGHTIGLHTYTHDYGKIYASEDAYFDDLQKISDLVKEQTGIESKVIRFPGGSSNLVSAEYSDGIMSHLVKEVNSKGYQYFDWNCDSTDASGNNVPVETIVANSLSAMGAEKINILMHDTDMKETTLEALPQIIEAYQKEGYVFRSLTKDSFAPHHEVAN